MARNYPQCEWIFNSTFIAEESDLLNTSTEAVEENYTETYGSECEYLALEGLPDAYVYTLITCYSIVMTIGFFGNLTVICTVLTVKELRIVMNLLLVALAFSDLIITIAMPFSFLSNISYTYNGPVAVCCGIPFIQGCAIMSGIYILVVIAFERYLAIVHPLRRKIINSPKRVGISVGIIWLISACFQTPLPVVMDVYEFQVLLDSDNLTVVEDCHQACFNLTFRRCGETWSLSQALGFSYAVLVVIYIIPLSSITYVYSKLGYFLWKRRPVGSASITVIRSYRRKKRLVTFLVVLVVTFAVMWGPYFILQCVPRGINRIAVGFMQLMGHSNVAVNPILYAYFHRKIRSHAVSYVRKASRLHRSQKSSNPTKRRVAVVGLQSSAVLGSDFTHAPTQYEFKQETQYSEDSPADERGRSSHRDSAFSYEDLVIRITEVRRQSQPLPENKQGDSDTTTDPPVDKIKSNDRNTFQTVPEFQVSYTNENDNVQSSVVITSITSLPNVASNNSTA